ncbi:fibrillarin-like rRNA/tRNA 2'-O-methyltransferase [Candidatus Parvarchaeota archaeon]|nr:fibrillarin-like rRNA/tRNA 2'-O-methyltransferase [Candidatus Parvarchaeota archaeon]
MKLENIGENIFWMRDGRKTLLTKNLVLGRSVYGERLIDINSLEYREWIPSKSKLGAAIYNGLRDIKIKQESKVLYLGASSGTTVSHVSDIVGVDGSVYAVEVSEEMAIKLIFLSEERKNIFPIVSDASKPEDYTKYVPSCDFLYQDIAQRNQVDIFIRNADLFLKKGGSAAIAIKTKSIDVYGESSEIIKESVKILKGRFKKVQSINLYPYQKNHSLLLCD